MTKDEGCWLNFMQKMRDVWSKPLAVIQREAEDRAKLPSETFHQLFFSKLKLLLEGQESEEDVMNCASHTLCNQWKSRLGDQGRQVATSMLELGHGIGRQVK